MTSCNGWPTFARMDDVRDLDLMPASGCGSGECEFVLLDLHVLRPTVSVSDFRWIHAQSVDEIRSSDDHCAAHTRGLRSSRGKELVVPLTKLLVLLREVGLANCRSPA